MQIESKSLRPEVDTMTLGKRLIHHAVLNIANDPIRVSDELDIDIGLPDRYLRGRLPYHVGRRETSKQLIYFIRGGNNPRYYGIDVTYMGDDEYIAAATIGNGIVITVPLPSDGSKRLVQTLDHLVLLRLYQEYITGKSEYTWMMRWQKITSKLKRLHYTLG